MGIGKFDIKLEQGSAIKPFNQMSDEEINQLGRRVFAKVYGAVGNSGQTPVISKLEGME